MSHPNLQALIYRILRSKPPNRFLYNLPFMIVTAERDRHEPTLSRSQRPAYARHASGRWLSVTSCDRVQPTSRRTCTVLLSSVLGCHAVDLSRRVSMLEGFLRSMLDSRAETSFEDTRNFCLSLLEQIALPSVLRSKSELRPCQMSTLWLPAASEKSQYSPNAKWNRMQPNGVGSTTTEYYNDIQLRSIPYFQFCNAPRSGTMLQRDNRILRMPQTTQLPERWSTRSAIADVLKSSACLVTFCSKGTII